MSASSNPSYVVPLPPLPPSHKPDALLQYVVTLRKWLQDFVNFYNLGQNAAAQVLGPAAIIPVLPASNPGAAAGSTATLFTINAYLDSDGVLKKTNTGSSSWALQFDTVADTATVLYCPPGAKAISWTAVNEIGGGAGTGNSTFTYNVYHLNATTAFFDIANTTWNGNLTIDGTVIQSGGTVSLANTTLANLTVTHNETVGGNLAITGTLGVTGNTTLGNLAVGATTLSTLTAGGLTTDTHNNVQLSGNIATTATDGFASMPFFNGPPTGVPRLGNGSYGFDYANSNFYIYNGGWIKQPGGPFA